MTWIKTESQEPSTEVPKEQEAKTVKDAGRLSKLFNSQALNPAAMQASLNLYQAIMSGPSSLSLIEREMIAVVVSKVLDCTFLVDAHAENLRDLTKDDRLVRLMKIDYRMLLLDDRVRTILDFAVQITKDSKSILESSIKELRDSGLKDEDILNALEVVGLFNYLTRLANVLGVKEESPEDKPSTTLAAMSTSAKR